MQLIDPTVATSAQTNQRAPALEALEGATLGLLSNGKLNADLLLHETAALFAAEHGCTVLPLAYKRNPSAPAAADTLEDLASRCDFMITATGD